MEEYINKGKEVLRILINNGYEAYFVGKFVRDRIMQLPITEIEINTNATPDAIKGIFAFTKVEDARNGLIRVMYSGYDFFLSTFHLEEYKDKRTPVRIHYSKNLLDDLSSRDFSINAIVMSHSDKITDAYGGITDINKKRIKTIGKAKVRFNENPMRILKAIGLVSELNFNIVNETAHAMKSRAKLLKAAIVEDVAFELKAIYQGKYAKKAMKLMEEMRISKNILSLKKGFRYINNPANYSFEEFLLISFILNGTIDESFIPTIENEDKFRKTFALALANPKAKYSKLELFNYGEEVALMANKVNVALKKSKKRYKQISHIYQELPVKSYSDLTFKEEDIHKLFEQEIDTKTIIDQVVYEILEGSLANDYNVIKDYVTILLKKMNIEIKEQIDYQFNHDLPDTEEKLDLNKSLEFNKLVNAENEDELKASLTHQGQIIKDYTEHRLDMLERRINEQAALLREKDLKYEELLNTTRRRQIQSDIDNLINKNMEMLKKMNYLDNTPKNRVELSRQLNQVYMNFINDMEDKYTNNEVNDEEN